MSSAPDSWPRLVGDIGGTNARFALIAAPGAPITDARTLPCASHAGPREAIDAYLAEGGLPRPRAAAIGIANPITGDAVRMTNNPWRFSIEQVRRELGLDRLLFINDFTALALALPTLAADELVQIGGKAAVPGKALALLGAGTGLGISGLVPHGERWVPLEGEGGHVTLAAFDAREARVVEALRRRHGGHVSAERVLSGPGLEALHAALAEVDELPADGLDAAAITGRALAGGCDRCAATVDMFCAMLGTVAADLALTLGARGGVYIGGGVVPRLGERFASSPFRARFEEKGRFGDYLAGIPVFVIHADYPALRGAARALDD
ncbi:glucokinase [Derxia gummosa]|uniref:Glucokinase n=1 Tax=Derxia gummosa DSM 723 TaxID=1121388 RepID=A0A8B6X7B4_9BURK|nr:glucokinase [Derxia gummosa]